MQILQDQALYSQILADENHWFESAVVIGEDGDLVTERGEKIIFGAGADATTISVVRSAPDDGFKEENIRSISTSVHMLGNGPVVGNAISGEVDVVLQDVVVQLPKMARIAPYVRARTEDLVSEWIPQGVFYIDTRSNTQDDDGIDLLTIHGYDAMLMFEQEFDANDAARWPNRVDPETGDTMGALDTEAVLYIAGRIGVQVDSRTWDVMTDEFSIPTPLGYYYREVLGYIAGAYGGCFVMTDAGNLRLVSLAEIPPQTNYLIDQVGDIIIFGSMDGTTVTGASVSFEAEIADPEQIGCTVVNALVLTIPFSNTPYEGAVVAYSGSDTSEYTDMSVSFEAFDEAVYGGTWDVLNGYVTSTYDENGDELEEPVTYQVLPNAPVVVVGENNIWSSDGSLSLTYAVDNGVKILV